jgi:hypothetical protein
MMPASKVATDQSQHPLVLDALRQSPHDHIVIDAIEELLEVDIDHDPLSFLDVPLRFAHGTVCVASRSEPVAVL